MSLNVVNFLNGGIKISILVFGLLAGAITGVGALIAIVIGIVSNRILAISLGFAAGIMIGISTLSLIPNSLEMGNIYIATVGFIVGAAFLFFVDRTIPHSHKIETDCREYAKMGYFIAFGIALHNLPEGIAIGATHNVSVQLGIYTAFTIGIHNIAEGLCVAMPLCLANVHKFRVVVITTLTGLSTLFGTWLGIVLGMVSPLVIAFFLAFAAGAMVYISSDELIPKSHRFHISFANMGILFGFVFALILS